MAFKLQLQFFLLLAVLYASQGRMMVGKNALDFSGYCSDRSIPPGSTYWQSLNLTLSDIVTNTPNATNMRYTVKHGGDEMTAFGEGICSMIGDPCRDCIVMLVKRAWAECSSSISGLLVLTGKCAIRYQDTPIETPTPTAPGPPRLA